MDVKAIATGIKQSPRKMGEVAGLVRGRSVADALVILDHTPRRAAQPLSKLIRSAAANATHNHKLVEKELAIKSLEVSPGLSMKRYRPAARGMALPYKRQTSNIRVVVSGPEKKAAAAKAKPASSTKKKESK